MAWEGLRGERDFSPLGLTGLNFLGDNIALSVCNKQVKSRYARN